MTSRDLTSRRSVSPTRAPAERRGRGGRIIPRDFYDRDTELVARDLLGAILECETPDGLAAGRIVETEAYPGDHDPACHAVFGRTERTWHLFDRPGTAYVYFIYGVHWCFNAVTREEGLGSAVLVRAIEPTAGIALIRRRRPAAKRDRDLTNGPGKLCQALGITGAHDGLSLAGRSPVRIRRGEPVPDEEVLVSERIGITVAADAPLRWFVRDNEFVSRTPSHFRPRPMTR